MIVLASASPRRRDLLTRFGARFDVLPARGVDEASCRGDARSIARDLAIAKARWSRRDALDRGYDARRLWVLGSDTLVTLGGEVLGKPATEVEARGMLERLSGRTHEVVTGVAVIPPSGDERVAVEVAPVTFRQLDAVTIDRYIATGDPMGKAGAYGIQSGGQELVAGFRSCYYCIVGLPVRLAFTLLDLPVPECDCGAHPLQRGEPGCRQT